MFSNLVSITQLLLGTICALTLSIPAAAQPNPKIRVPFTAQTETTIFDSNGNVRFKQRILHAIRSDGSHAEVRISSKAGGLAPRIILDLQKSERISLDQVTESKTTYPFTPGMKSAYSVTPDSCGEALDSPRSLLLGMNAVRIKPRLGDRYIEMWVAPDLNCFPLSDTVWSKEGGSMLRTSTTLSISLGEPEAALFDVPSTYVERSPVEVSIEREKRTGKAIISNPSAARTFENAYNQAQSNKKQ